jgi:hypothetical protein
MLSRVFKSVSWALALAFVASLPHALAAQVAAKSARAAAVDDSPSKWDIFAGYSYLAPHGTVGTTEPLTPQAIDYGAILSVARYFNKYAGVQLEADEHILNQTPFMLPSCNSGCGSTYANDDFSGGSGGLIFRFPSADVTPFVHALVGVEYAGTLHSPNDVFGAVLTAGGGMDYSTPFFDHHLAIRVFQADFQYTHENWPSGRGNFKMARLSAGFVYHIGSITPPPPVTLSCSASPASIFPGDPVSVTATAGALDPKLNAVYSWTGDGVTGTGTTVTVATGSLAAGTYTVKATVKEGKPGKEGLKPGGLLGQLYGEGIRATDHQLHGRSHHHQAGRDQRHHLSGYEPAKPPANVYLYGVGRHGDRQRHHGNVLFRRCTDGCGGDNLQCVR